MAHTFSIGDRIEMTQTASSMGRAISENKYASQVLDFDNRHTIKVSMPIFEGKIIPLDIGDDYQLVFFTKNGLLRCIGRIRKRYTEDKMHVMDVSFITEVKKFQRRNYYRLECMFTVRFRTWEEDVPAQDDGSEKKEEIVIRDWEEGTVSDLSGGGIRFRCGRQFEPEAYVEVLVPLSFKRGIVPFRAKMRVVSCRPYELKSSVYEVRGEFLEVSDTERETVVQYVFQEQRRRLKKE